VKKIQQAATKGVSAPSQSNGTGQDGEANAVPTATPKDLQAGLKQSGQFQRGKSKKNADGDDSGTELNADVLSYLLTLILFSQGENLYQ
jgi:hypothetical protein